MSSRILVCVALACLAAGCANFTTISRRSELPNRGKAVHLDPTQRLVYVSKDGYICAEPSPDALQSIAASNSLGISAPTQGAISVADALQANAASIGLRTQSITLMRDELYRICEQGYNGKLSNNAVLQMMQRSQDLTLGVLAIEQLTGAVVAKQVLLTGESNATASANIANTQKMLDRAQTTEDEKKEASTKATDAKKAAHETLGVSMKALEDAKKASPAPSKEDMDKLVKKQKDDQTAADKADAAAKAAQADYDTAQKSTQAIRDNLNAAITTATAMAKGSGTFSGGDTKTTIDKDTVVALANATTEIVRLVTEKGHLLDVCMNLATDTALPAVKKWCDDAIAAYIKVYTRYGEEAATRASQTAPGGSDVMMRGVQRRQSKGERMRQNNGRRMIVGGLSIAMIVIGFIDGNA